nr:DUF6735 family protein [Halorussus halophilus]
MRRRELFCTQLTGDRRPTVAQGSVDCTRPRTPVDITPLASELTLEAILTEQLNYANHEAFYVVSREFDVTAYRTHWFGLHHVADTAEQSPLHGNGAIRTVRWYDGDPVGDGFARGEFKALKRVVADLLDRDVFSQEQAIQYLEAKLRAWTNDHCELVVRTP